MVPFVPKSRSDNLTIRTIPRDIINTKRRDRKVFRHEMSVFKPWRPDTKRTIEDCVRCDMENWKIYRICKSPEDL